MSKMGESKFRDIVINDDTVQTEFETETPRRAAELLVATANKAMPPRVAYRFVIGEAETPRNEWPPEAESAWWHACERIANEHIHHSRPDPVVQRHNIEGPDHNPTARLGAVPWPKNLIGVIVDSEGLWWPDADYAYGTRCRQCDGCAEILAGRPSYCPWCGAALIDGDVVEQTGGDFLEDLELRHSPGTVLQRARAGKGSDAGHDAYVASCAAIREASKKNTPKPKKQVTP